MKTQIILLSIAAMSLQSPLGVNSMVTGTTETRISKPQNTQFAFFRTHRQGKGVTATWGLTNNTSTGCFMVQRTYQDPNDPYAAWEDLNFVPITGARSFKWTDENVYPGFINYRVVAFQFDGSNIYSPVSQVRIVSH